MKLRFWGVRGSIPSPMPLAEFERKLELVLAGAGGPIPEGMEAATALVSRFPPLVRGCLGGNTPCLELLTGDPEHGGRIVLDCGSGLRLLGNQLMASGEGAGKLELRVLVSHTHWDHVQGFPFFVPAYVPGNNIVLHGPFQVLRERFVIEQQAEQFPVPLEAMRANPRFSPMDLDEPLKLAGARVRAFRLSHPGGAFGYRIEFEGKTFVYATDSEYGAATEHRLDDGEIAYSNADLLVCDSMFSFQEVLEKHDWGHSSSFNAADLALRAGVKRLALFHLDPAYPDEVASELLEETRAYVRRISPASSLDVFLAQEGDCIPI